MNGKRVAVLADDLTGATDSVVQFAQAGWNSYLVLDNASLADIRDLEGYVAMAWSLDSRALPDDEAEEITRSAVARALTHGFTRLFVKIDSTVRGSVRGQVAGALEALKVHDSQAVAVVCPAYPTMGRTVHNGVLYVDGTPVHETAIGTDPVTPVCTSQLVQLFPTAVPVAELPTELTPGVVFAVDACDDRGISRLASRIASVSHILPVGSAGLAGPLAALWGASGTEGASAELPLDGVKHVLIVASSLNPVSRRQVDELAAHAGSAIRIVEVPTADLLDSRAVQSWETIAAEGEPASVTVVRSTGDRTTGAGIGDAQRIAAGLAAVGTAALASTQDALTILVGGDGARAALALWHAGALRVHGTLAEGVPFSTVVAGSANGMRVATKAGGFGDTATLVQIVQRVTARKEIQS